MDGYPIWRSESVRNFGLMIYRKIHLWLNGKSHAVSHCSKFVTFSKIQSVKTLHPVRFGFQLLAIYN